MSNRAPLCAWVAACVLAVPSMGAAQERAARDVVETIVREGPRAAAIRAEVEVVRREQRARTVFPNPALAFSREGAGFTEFFQIEQLLPVFGVRGALTRAGVAATAAAEADRDARLWDLRVEATGLITRLLWAQSRVDASSADVAAVQRLVDVLRVREREGEGSRFDRLRAEQELADLQRAGLVAAVEAVDARGAVLALLPPGSTVERVAAFDTATRIPLDVDGLAQRARAARAELRALQYAENRTAREAEAARLARRPAPLLSGGTKRADTTVSRERGPVLGVSVAVPLFDTGGRDAARWAAEGARLAAERMAFEQEVSADITRAVEALRLRQQALESAQDDALGTELITTAEVAYREGEIGIVALLDAVRTVSRARLRDIERRLELRLAQIALERAVGEELWP